MILINLSLKLYRLRIMINDYKYSTELILFIIIYNSYYIILKTYIICMCVLCMYVICITYNIL